MQVFPRQAHQTLDVIHASISRILEDQHVPAARVAEQVIKLAD
jgi:hypothetical protein